MAKQQAAEHPTEQVGTPPVQEDTAASTTTAEPETPQPPESAPVTDFTLAEEPGIELPTGVGQAAQNWTPDHSKCHQIEYLRERFVGTILQNPNLERFTLGNPLEPGKRGDFPNAGALLAHLCDDLATAYYEAAAQIDESRRERLGVKTPVGDRVDSVLHAAE